ncbi:MAG: hypothetical protein KatS3mg102_2075 [Planctomycetota bacterium]|nr:MAG: hypothetical protein KatS3mg102_2075 [Planctomycetota bacterium]
MPAARVRAAIRERVRETVEELVRRLAEQSADATDEAAVVESIAALAGSGVLAGHVLGRTLAELDEALAAIKQAQAPPSAPAPEQDGRAAFAERLWRRWEGGLELGHAGTEAAAFQPGTLGSGERLFAAVQARLTRANLAVLERLSDGLGLGERLHHLDRRLGLLATILGGVLAEDGVESAGSRLLARALGIDLALQQGSARPMYAKLIAEVPELVVALAAEAAGEIGGGALAGVQLGVEGLELPGGALGLGGLEVVRPARRAGQYAFSASVPPALAAGVPGGGAGLGFGARLPALPALVAARASGAAWMRAGFAAIAPAVAGLAAAGSGPWSGAALAHGGAVQPSPVPAWSGLFGALAPRWAGMAHLALGYAGLAEGRRHAAASRALERVLGGRAVAAGGASLLAAASAGEWTRLVGLPLRAGAGASGGQRPVRLVVTAADAFGVPRYRGPVELPRSALASLPGFDPAGSLLLGRAALATPRVVGLAGPVPAPVRGLLGAGMPAAQGSAGFSIDDFGVVRIERREVLGPPMTTLALGLPAFAFLPAGAVAAGGAVAAEPGAAGAGIGLVRPVIQAGTGGMPAGWRHRAPGLAPAASIRVTPSAARERLAAPAPAPALLSPELAAALGRALPLLVGGPALAAVGFGPAPAAGALLGLGAAAGGLAVGVPPVRARGGVRRRRWLGTHAAGLVAAGAGGGDGQVRPAPFEKYYRAAESPGLALGALGAFRLPAFAGGRAVGAAGGRLGAARQVAGADLAPLGLVRLTGGAVPGVGGFELALPAAGPSWTAGSFDGAGFAPAAALGRTLQRLRGAARAARRRYERLSREVAAVEDRYAGGLAERLLGMRGIPVAAAAPVAGARRAAPRLEVVYGRPEAWLAGEALRVGAAVAGRGRPLPSDVAVQLEPLFGRELLRSVRVHTGDRADALARRFRTPALVMGRDVYFARGAYQPGTPEGVAMLAHELAHVRRPYGAIARFVDPVSAPGELAARAAERAGAVAGPPAARPGVVYGMVPQQIYGRFEDRFRLDGWQGSGVATRVGGQPIGLELGAAERRLELGFDYALVQFRGEIEELAERARTAAAVPIDLTSQLSGRTALVARGVERRREQALEFVTRHFEVPVQALFWGMPEQGGERREVTVELRARYTAVEARRVAGRLRLTDVERVRTEADYELVPRERRPQGQPSAKPGRRRAPVVAVEQLPGEVTVDAYGLHVRGRYEPARTEVRTFGGLGADVLLSEDFRQRVARRPQARGFELPAAVRTGLDVERASAVIARNRFAAWEAQRAFQMGLRVPIGTAWMLAVQEPGQQEQREAARPAAEPMAVVAPVAAARPDGDGAAAAPAAVRSTPAVVRRQAPPGVRRREERRALEAAVEREVLRLAREPRQRRAPRMAMTMTGSGAPRTASAEGAALEQLLALGLGEGPVARKGLFGWVSNIKKALGEVGEWFGKLEKARKPQAPAPDINQLVYQVYHRIRKELELERERIGGW